MLRPRTGSSADLLAVGLGNPGSDYGQTRHNLGAATVDLLARRHGSPLRRSRSLGALASEATVGGRALALAFPQTFMNDSGRAVQALVRRYGILELARLVVIHDELDLPVGTVRVKLGGGTAGHNGLRSIEAHVGGTGFARVRIGIGRPPGRGDGARYVLSAPRGKEREALAVSVEEAADAVELVLRDGVDAAMNAVNGR